MNTCNACGKVFDNPLQLTVHMDNNVVRIITKEPLSYVLCLPDGTQPGRHEAAEAFAYALAELKQKHPDKQFTLIPFSYWTWGKGIRETEGDSALSSILAVAN